MLVEPLAYKKMHNYKCFLFSLYFRAFFYGFRFISSPQDIEQFKAEIEKRQLKDLPIPGVLSELAGKPEKEGAGDEAELKEPTPQAES